MPIKRYEQEVQKMLWNLVISSISPSGSMKNQKVWVNVHTQ